jgi:hypothetical protein
MKYTVEMASDGMTYISSAMMTGLGIRVILGLIHTRPHNVQFRNLSNIKGINYLNNLRGYNVGTIDETS